MVKWNRKWQRGWKKQGWCTKCGDGSCSKAQPQQGHQAMCLPNISDACLTVWCCNLKCIKSGPEEAKDVPNEMSP